MSEPTKNPFDMLLDQIRVIVREEIKANANGTAAKGDRLLDPQEAANLLSVSEDWLYHNARKLPFTRKLRPRLLRFSYQGLIKWMESKKFGNLLITHVTYVTNDPMTPKQILKLRTALGLTQQQLADRIGAARESVARWEAGSHPPKGANLKALKEMTAKKKGGHTR
jgi:DNA-binding transcriptional regulator YiaG